MSTDAIDFQKFRNLVRNVPGQVSIIPTSDAGRRAGSMASAVCSLTDDPPTVIVCIDRDACAHDAIIESGYFSVNALAAGQARIAKAFSAAHASMAHQLFAQDDWTTGVTGVPILAAAVCRFECRLSEWRAASAHTVLFGQVIAGSAAPDAEPLMQLRGVYVGAGQHARPQPDAAAANVNRASV